jgi:hypothetical protein
MKQSSREIIGMILLEGQVCAYGMWCSGEDDKGEIQGSLRCGGKKRRLRSRWRALVVVEMTCVCRLRDARLGLVSVGFMVCGYFEGMFWVVSSFLL